MMQTDLTQEKLQALFSYKDGVLYWKYNPARSPQWNGRFESNPAGCIRPDGRRVIRIEGVLHLASRLIFLYHKGYLPSEVDHKDTDQTNDRIENLRPANRAMNNANTNASGYFRRGKRFYGRIYHHGKSHHLGAFDTAYEANQAYRAAQQELLEDYHEG